jgi:hypothetical protein
MYVYFLQTYSMLLCSGSVVPGSAHNSTCLTVSPDLCVSHINCGSAHPSSCTFVLHTSCASCTSCTSCASIPCTSLQYTWLQHQPRHSIWLRAVALVSRPVDYSLLYNNCWDLADK